MNEADAPAIRADVVNRVVADVIEQSRTPGGRPVHEVINETLFHEKRRLARRREGGDEDWRFYRELRRKLPQASNADAERSLAQVVTRYADEISGHFDPRIYRFTTSVMNPTLTGLLNGLSPTRLLRRRGNLQPWDEMLVRQGEVDKLLHLRERGTILLVPTHSSNLDSIVLGAAIERMGLPPFTYGAGLNLFDNRIIGYFMHNLGAYTVDRLKSDPLYRKALKEYSTVALEYGRHSLFFPGGTRSRSGCVESYLKKGLLGTALDAYRNSVALGRVRKVYIVPVTLNYPLVLEAATLIDDHLQISGQSRHIIVDDEFSRLEKWAKYTRGLFALDMHIYLRFGEPLDPFGNDVNDDGESLDPQGRVIDPSEYLRVGGEIVEDVFRDREYTRLLAGRIVDSFHRNTVACATNVVAYALFSVLRRNSGESDLYRFLRSITPEVPTPVDAVLVELRALLDELAEMNRQGRIQLGEIEKTMDADLILGHALKRFSAYHTDAAARRDGSFIAVDSPNLLFYYRNRLDGLGLRGQKSEVPRRFEQ